MTIRKELSVGILCKAEYQQGDRAQRAFINMALVLYAPY